MRRYSEIQEILRDIQADPKVQRMNGYVQHGRVTTYEHSESVARLCYRLNRLFSLHADLKVLLVGAMLHDFYLYDWHDDDDNTHRLHGFTHPNVAARNARELFGVDDRTAKVIESHMWPLTLTKMPRSKEAWLVCMADKLCSLYETLFRR